MKTMDLAMDWITDLSIFSITYSFGGPEKSRFLSIFSKFSIIWIFVFFLFFFLYFSLFFIISDFLWNNFSFEKFFALNCINDGSVGKSIRHQGRCPRRCMRYGTTGFHMWDHRTLSSECQYLGHGRCNNKELSCYWHLMCSEFGVSGVRFGLFEFRLELLTDDRECGDLGVFLAFSQSKFGHRYCERACQWSCHFSKIRINLLKWYGE